MEWRFSFGAAFAVTILSSLLQLIDVRRFSDWLWGSGDTETTAVDSADAFFKSIFMIDVCQVNRVDARAITWSRFISEYGHAPVIITHALGIDSDTSSAWAPGLWTKDALVARFGQLSAVLSGDNFIADQFMQADPKRDSMRTFGSFLRDLQFGSQDDKMSPIPRADVGPQWMQTAVPVEQVPLPARLFAAHPVGPKRVGAYISLGEMGSGAVYHSHTRAAIAQLHGRKHWFLLPPEALPNATRDADVARSLLRTPGSWRRPPSASVLQCTQRPSELLWLPPWWWHATLNVDDSAAAISQFETPDDVHERYPSAVFSLRKANERAVCERYPFQFQVVVPAIQALLQKSKSRELGRAKFVDALDNLKWLVREDVIDKQQARAVLARFPARLFDDDLRRLAMEAFPVSQS